MFIISMFAVSIVAIAIYYEMIEDEIKEYTDYEFRTNEACQYFYKQNERFAAIEAKRKATVRSFFKVPQFNN